MGRDPAANPHHQRIERRASHARASRAPARARENGMTETIDALANALGSRVEALAWLGERAAIREYMGEQTRKDAEKGAIEDARRFLDRPSQVTSK